MLQEVEMLSSSKAMKELTEEQQNLQKELESLQNEHAQRMEEFYIEQRDLEKKLEQVMKQKCTCDSNLEKDKEAEYAAQVSTPVTQHGWALASKPGFRTETTLNTALCSPLRMLGFKVYTTTFGSNKIL